MGYEQRTQLASPGDVGDALMDCAHDETACEVCGIIIKISEARDTFAWWRSDSITHCSDCPVH